ncbi:MAG: type I methionyl aminopeptidase [Parcubacteria group bacterium]
MKPIIKSEKDLALLEVSGRILKTVLEEVSKAAAPGVKLSFLDRLAFDLISSYDATPSFLGYRPEGAKRAYPASICASLGSVVVHGIPDKRELKEGDVLKIDMGVNYKDRFTDSARTIVIGKTSPEITRLLRATEEALYAGIEEVRPGKRLGDIGFAISSVAKKYGVSVIDGLAGHGVGFAPHEDPLVFNVGRVGTGALIEEGMVLALEPMFSLGTSEVFELPDGSFKTVDGKPAAHFEHTVFASISGPKILTS